MLSFIQNNFLCSHTKQSKLWCFVKPTHLNFLSWTCADAICRYLGFVNGLKILLFMYSNITWYFNCLCFSSDTALHNFLLHLCLLCARKKQEIMFYCTQRHWVEVTISLRSECLWSCSVENFHFVTHYISGRYGLPFPIPSFFFFWLYWIEKVQVLSRLLNTFLLTP